MFVNWNRLEIAALSLTALVYLILVIFTPAGFWIIDEGSKFLWSENFIETGSLQLQDNAERISPGHSAFKKPFTFSDDDKANVYTVFNPLFIIIIGPFVKLGGLKLALMVPLICTLLLIISLRKLSNRLNLPFKWFSILIIGLGSPLLFYSITLWEHSLALLLGMVAINFFHTSTTNYYKRI